MYDDTPPGPPHVGVLNAPPPPQPRTDGARQTDSGQRSTNRLSGFFNNLILRRDPHPAHDDSSTPRSSSPAPPRSATPPPTLPPPTLQELGLSLSEITTGLSPSHFTNLPFSGAFLSPHYLLLCHSQGLDVLPIFSPPAPQPYALIRRVCFKSVVVMEHRGVLVAIAGRRDGVRVYALEEVRKAIEWRIDVEVRRERDRQRRENSKKQATIGREPSSARFSDEKSRQPSLSVPPPRDPAARTMIPRKTSSHLSFTSDHTPISPLTPRPPVPRSPTRRPRTPRDQFLHPFGHPPPYASAEVITASEPVNLPLTSDSSITVHARASSLNSLLGSTFPRPSTSSGGRVIKTNWEDSSDDEAINIVAAGASGSQALDERTSATHNATTNSSLPSVISHAPSPPLSRRRNRPANLDLSLAHPDASMPPSPTPTLLTLRQALSLSPVTNTATQSADTVVNGTDLVTPIGDGEVDDDDENTEGRISLAQALLESRLPDLPPIGTMRPQQPILIPASHTIISVDEESASPRTSEGHTPSASHQSIAGHSQGRRRRWSVIISPTFAGSDCGSELTPDPLVAVPPSSDGNIPRITSSRSIGSRRSSLRPSTAPGEPPISIAQPANSSLSIHASRSSRSSRFLSRILNNAFHSRRSEDHSHSHSNEAESSRKTSATLASSHPPPKLEYVKLPGTKGSLLVKAVETPKKSFLAILCGESGEKVELFAGTYRTALGLSRTFILPDSPRSLELQLQGDDLVEVFLVFPQNVFGLEPATVRVREVRIGRAERRAARRRAREMQANDNGPAAERENVEEETNVNVNVSVAIGTLASRDGTGRPPSPTLIPVEHPDAQVERQPSPEPTLSPSQAQADEVLAIATAQMGPYTTFQQLSFAPRFPMASIADEYIIPPTYPDFIEYRDVYEPDVNVNGKGTAEQSQAQFSPPGLPIPPPAPPSKWYYRDPKGIVHGPWKASLMQAWYKDGLLPLDLPVRREEDMAYTQLRDLRLQSVDPTHPFRPPQPQVTSLSTVSEPRSRHSEKPLLQPISLLAQPKHFGPPALFYSSRGGHSTTIVDARGRSVLKGRFIWSNDNVSEEFSTRMGDVKRLEAFDVKDRSVLVAMRQGGLEAVDLRDALLRPADESRTALPQFNPPISNINRRAPFVWKIGTPVSTSPSSSHVSPTGSRQAKKQSTGPAKSPASRSEFSLGDSGLEHQDEVLFLGRTDDQMYLCERNVGSFRILRLSPQAS